MGEKGLSRQPVMRIAFVVGNFPVISQTFILNQITGLIDLGHDVRVFSYDRGDPGKGHPDMEKYGLPERTVYLWDRSRSFLSRLASAPGLWLRHVLKYGKPFGSPALMEQVERISGQGKFDVVHCQFGTFGIKYLPLHEFGATGGKLVVNFRGYDISEFVRENGGEVYRTLFKKADAFVTNCDFFRRRLLELGAPSEKTAVVFSGINCDLFRFSGRCPAPDGVVRIGMTGRLVEKKGIEYGIRAVAELIRRGKRAEFYVIGEGPIKEDLTKLIDELGVKDRVKLLGARNQNEIIEILRSCHLFMAPSVTSKSGDQDAPVNVLKEAMAMGLPVVSTRHGGIPELVEEGISGYLVDERDASALAERLGHLIDHPELWPLLGRAGRACIEKQFDMKKLNQDLVNIYQRLMSEKGL